MPKVAALMEYPCVELYAEVLKEQKISDFKVQAFHEPFGNALAPNSPASEGNSFQI